MQLRNNCRRDSSLWSTSPAMFLMCCFFVQFLMLLEMLLKMFWLNHIIFLKKLVSSWQWAVFKYSFFKCHAVPCSSIAFSHPYLSVSVSCNVSLVPTVAKHPCVARHPYTHTNRKPCSCVHLCCCCCCQSAGWDTERAELVRLFLLHIKEKEFYSMHILVVPYADYQAAAETRSAICICM